MSVPNGEKLATKQDLADMYQGILPYLGGMPEVLANKFSKGDLYSTEEKMIGQWIDSKPLYQKTIDCGMLLNESTKDVDTGVSNIDILVSVVGISIDTSRIIKPLPFIYASSTIEDMKWNEQILVKLVNGSYYVSIKAPADRTTEHAYVTIKYTKTTDSAISIGSDTDYSTEEKIVGTWIDSKPIYQKTVIIDSITGVVDNTFSTFTANIASLNVDSVIYINGILKTASGSWQEVNYRTTNAGLQIKLQVGITDTSELIQLVTNTASVNNGIVYVTLQYTKTT